MMQSSTNNWSIPGRLVSGQLTSHVNTSNKSNFYCNIFCYPISNHCDILTTVNDQAFIVHQTTESCGWPCQYWVTRATPIRRGSIYPSCRNQKLAHKKSMYIKKKFLSVHSLCKVDQLAINILHKKYNLTNSYYRVS